MNKKMMKTIIPILIFCSCLNIWASKLVNSPFVIGDETYWLVLNDTLKEKGKIWDYDTAASPPLLPNEVIKIAREILANQNIADRTWKIHSVNLRQLTQTQNHVLEDGSTNTTNYAYSYYEVGLSEKLSEQEIKNRVSAGETTLAELSMIIKMDGEAVLPEKGEQLKDVLTPELWEKYKLRHGIE